MRRYFPKNKGNKSDNCNFRGSDGKTTCPEGNALPDNLDEWLTTREAAAFLKVSESVLRNMCSNGQVPFYKLESRNRYRRDDLMNLLLNSKKGGFNAL